MAGVQYLIFFIFYCFLRFTEAQTEQPNRALFEFVTTELKSKEAYYVILQTRDIFRKFNVSFVFPLSKWEETFSNQDSDSFHCFKSKIQRRLSNEYYKNDVEFVGSHFIEYRNSTSKGVIGDFELEFKKKKPWPTWNVELLKANVPATFLNLLPVYTFPEISDSYNPKYNYTAFEIEWFQKIAVIQNIFDQKKAFAYKGYYNLTALPSDYNGPQIFALYNMVLYACVGFNVFTIFVALLFWFVNCNRKKLLLSYWVKEERPRMKKELTPGQM